MEAYVFIKDGRIHGISDTETPGSIKLNVPDEVHQNPLVFKYENGQFIKDAIYQQQKIEEVEKRKNQPSQSELIEALRKQNADLAFDLMMKGVI